MTCIAAIIFEGRVYMAADSCGSDGVNYRVRRDSKLFRLGEFIIGFTSSFRMGQLLQYQMQPPILPGDPRDLYRYLCTTFIERARKLLGDNGGHFLIGTRGRIFEVMSDFQVAEYDRDYAAIGSGKPWAEGALMVQSKDVPPRGQLFLAMSAAAAHAVNVRPTRSVASCWRVIGWRRWGWKMLLDWIMAAGAVSLAYGCAEAWCSLFDKKPAPDHKAAALDESAKIQAFWDEQTAARRSRSRTLPPPDPDCRDSIGGWVAKGCESLKPPSSAARA